MRTTLPPRRSTPHFVEEVGYQGKVAPSLRWLRTLERHRYEETLLVRREVEIDAKSHVGKFGFDPDSWPLRDKRVTLRGVTGQHRDQPHRG